MEYVILVVAGKLNFKRNQRMFVKGRKSYDAVWLKNKALYFAFVSVVQLS